MSLDFDSTFDDGNAIAAINNIITTNQDEIVKNNTILNNINNLKNAYDSSLNICRDIDVINRAIVRSQTINSYYIQLIADIQNLNTLSPESKSTIYNFYVAYPISKQIIMSILIYNAESMASDCEIILNDSGISSDEKTFLAQYVYSKYKGYHISPNAFNIFAGWKDDTVYDALM